MYLGIPFFNHFASCGWHMGDYLLCDTQNLKDIYNNGNTEEGIQKSLEFFRVLYTMVHDVHNYESIVMPVMDGLTCISLPSFLPFLVFFSKLTHSQWVLLPVLQSTVLLPTLLQKLKSPGQKQVLSLFPIEETAVCQQSILINL